MIWRNVLCGLGVSRVRAFRFQQFLMVCMLHICIALDDLIVCISNSASFQHYFFSFGAMFRCCCEPACRFNGRNETRKQKREKKKTSLVCPEHS